MGRRRPRRWGRTIREAALHLGLPRYAETRRENSGKRCVTKMLAAAGRLRQRVSQPRRPKIRLRRCRGQSRVAPVRFDDLDGRVWVNFGLASAY
jgi:hypothetical protein